MSLGSQLSNRAAATREVSGRTVAARFSDPAEEYRAFHMSAVMIPAPARGRILVTESERVEFLQGQLSNDLTALKSGEGQPTLVLTAQGRVVGRADLYVLDDRIELCTDADATQAIYDRLDQFLIADDVELESSVLDDAGVWVVGPDTIAVVRRLMPSIPESSEASWWHREKATRFGSLTARGRGDFREPSVELFLHSADAEGANEADAEALLRWLESEGVRPAGYDTLERLRIESGTPRHGVDVDDLTIAIEARLEWAIHFAKGCYVGQEVVERAVSRGRVNRLLCLLETASPIDPGASIVGAGDKNKVTSVVEAETGRRLLLAYLPAADAKAGSCVEIADANGQTAEAVILPWPRPTMLQGREAG